MCFTGSDWEVLSFNSFVSIGPLLRQHKLRLSFSLQKSSSLSCASSSPKSLSGFSGAPITPGFVDGLFYRQPFRSSRPDIRPRYSVLSPARYGSVFLPRPLGRGGRLKVWRRGWIPNSELNIRPYYLLLRSSASPWLLTTDYWLLIIPHFRQLVNYVNLFT